VLSVKAKDYKGRGVLVRPPVERSPLTPPCSPDGAPDLFGGETKYLNQAGTPDG